LVLFDEHSIGDDGEYFGDNETKLNGEYFGDNETQLDRFNVLYNEALSSK
jgi:hypothetical protein